MISPVSRRSHCSWLCQLAAWLALVVSITGRGLHDCHVADHWGLAHRHAGLHECGADRCAPRLAVIAREGKTECPYAARARRLARQQGIPQWADIDGSSRVAVESRAAHVCPICQVLAQAQLGASQTVVQPHVGSTAPLVSEMCRSFVGVDCHVPPLRGPPAIL